MHLPSSVPPNSTQNNEQVPEAGACYLQATGPNSGQSAAFPRGCPMPQWPCHVSQASQETPAGCSTRCFPCSPGDCTPCLTLSSPQRPEQWPRVSGNSPSNKHHITSDGGKPFQDSLYQHLGCRHTASHRAFPWESFGFTARAQKLIGD